MLAVRMNLDPAESEIDNAAQVPGSSSRAVVGYCVKVASLTRTSFPATTRCGCALQVTFMPDKLPALS